MELSIIVIILLAVVCFTAGFIDSIAGGGGLLTIPSFMLAGIPGHYVLGTNKFVATLGTGIATGNFIHKKKANFKIIAAGIIFAFAGSFIGAEVIQMFESDMVNKIIIFLMPVGIAATLIPRKNKPHEAQLGKVDFLAKVPLITFVIGFYDGFFGPGTGSFLALSFYIFLHLELVEATANAKIFNFASNIAALVSFIIEGQVFYKIAIPLAAANMAGNFLGSHLALKKGEKVIKFFLVLVLIILSATLIWKFFLRDLFF